MRHLEEHGARRSPGYRVRQEVLAEQVGIPPRRLREYLARMEEYGLLHVRRTTVDAAFGSPRGFNIYTLKASADDWEQRLGPAYINQRRERLHNRASALARNQQAEIRRKAEGPARKERTPRPSPVVLPRDELDELARAYDDESDEDLAGW